MADLFQNKEALQAAHAQTEEILESIADVFYALDKDYRYTYVNSKAEEIWGRKREEMLGKTLWEVFPQVKSSESERMHIHAMETRKVVHYETLSPILHRWISVGIYPSQSGGLSVYFRDIEDRRRAEEALRKSEERHRLIMESMVDFAIYTLDMEGRVTSWNTGAENIFGFSAEEIMGQTTDVLFTPEDLAAGVLRTEMETALKHGRASDERWHMRKDGSRFYASGVTNILHNGHTQGFVKVARDLTERKSAEEALREAEERQRIVLEAAELCTWDWDVAGGKVMWNEQCYRLLGLPNDNHTPQSQADFALFLHPDDRERAQADVAAAVAGTDPYQSEFRIVRADNGAVRWMSSYGKAMNRDERGRATRITGVMYDITQRKEVEQRKDEFLGVASHELKTPLTAMKAYAEVLEEMMADNADPAGAGEVVRKLDDSIERLDRLIRELLDATRLNEGRLELKREPFDLAALVRECVEESQETTRRHRLEVEADQVSTVRADRERIRQVVSNILSNAIKYSPASDRIVVSVAQKNDKVEVCVQDFGVGISSAATEKVFDRFFREPDPNVSTFPGLGLGLYIAREIVQLHGGELTVESRKGEGSTFCFMLPLGA